MSEKKRVKLPRYKLISQCVKCGEKSASSEWKCFIPKKLLVEFTRITHEEHELRTCRNCEYQWAEAPLDADKDSGEPDFDAELLENTTFTEGYTPFHEGKGRK